MVLLRGMAGMVEHNRAVMVLCVFVFLLCNCQGRGQAIVEESDGSGAADVVAARKDGAGDGHVTGIDLNAFLDQGAELLHDGVADVVPPEISLTDSSMEVDAGADLVELADTIQPLDHGKGFDVGGDLSGPVDAIDLLDLWPELLDSTLQDVAMSDSEAADSVEDVAGDLVGEATSGICEPCKLDSNCFSGACKKVPDGNGVGKFCTYSQDYCVFVDPYHGNCDFVVSGGSACAATAKAVECTNGTWSNTDFCKWSKPLCWEGECKACIPGSVTCYSNVAKACGDDGAWLGKITCPEDYTCVKDVGCVEITEFIISSTALSFDGYLGVSAKVAARAGGGFAVVYNADEFLGGSEADVLIRLYDSLGEPTGAQESFVNTALQGRQENPDIDGVPGDDGGFVVVWEHTVPPDDSGLVGSQILGQRLADNGTPLGASFAVDKSLDGEQMTPKVAARHDGTFVVVWRDVDGAGELSKVLAQGFAADGKCLGDSFPISTNPGKQLDPSISHLEGVGFVVAWSSEDFPLSPDGSDLYYQRYDNSLAPLGTEQPLNTVITNSQTLPTSVGFQGPKAGEFAAVWNSSSQDGNFQGVFMNLFDQAGEKVYVSDIPVNTKVTSGSQADAALAVLDDNRLVATWRTPSLQPDMDSLGIAARLFTAEGVAIGDAEFLVNQTTKGLQYNSDVAALPGNRYVIVWTSIPTPNQKHVYGRVFHGD
jgi:hypothetical protein